MKEEQTFPAWFYGPDGEAAVFDSADDVPKGWADHPGNAKAAVAEPKADPFDHDEDGKPGGSKPKTRRKVNRRDAGK